MRPHPRIRRTIKWGGLVVVLMMCAAWTLSEWRMVGWTGRRRGAWFSRGCVAFFVPDLALGDWSSQAEFESKGWFFQPQPRAFERFYLAHEYRTWYGWFVHIPLWIPLVPTAATTLLAWHLDAKARLRARANGCPTCDYDRTGLAPRAVCPECGAAPVTGTHQNR